MKEKHTAFRYDFTFSEMKYFLFGKKICPHCGGKLIRKKTFETKNWGAFHTRSDDDHISRNALTKHYQYFYICESCGRSYPLKELSETIR